LLINCIATKSLNKVRFDNSTLKYKYNVEGLINNLQYDHQDQIEIIDNTSHHSRSTTTNKDIGRDLNVNRDKIFNNIMKSFGDKNTNVITYYPVSRNADIKSDKNSNNNEDASYDSPEDINRSK